MALSLRARESIGSPRDAVTMAGPWVPLTQNPSYFEKIDMVGRAIEVKGMTADGERAGSFIGLVLKKKFDKAEKIFLEIQLCGSSDPEYWRRFSGKRPELANPC